MTNEYEDPTEGERCSLQEASEVATRFARLGLEAAAVPLSFLPATAREHLRHSAADTLHGLAVAPRVAYGIMEEVARDIETPVADSDLGSRQRAENEPPDSRHDDTEAR